MLIRVRLEHVGTWHTAATTTRQGVNPRPWKPALADPIQRHKVGAPRNGVNPCCEVADGRLSAAPLSWLATALGRPTEGTAGTVGNRTLRLSWRGVRCDVVGPNTASCPEPRIYYRSILANLHRQLWGRGVFMVIVLLVVGFFDRGKPIMHQ